MSNDQHYGGQPYDPYAGGQQDPDVTQTWEGQTWDTQYQPAVRPRPQAPGPYEQSHGEQSYGEQSHGEQSYGEQSYGEQPHGEQSYGGQPYGGQPYGERQPYPPQSYGGQDRAHESQAYGQPQPQTYEQQPQQQPYAGAYPAQSQQAAAPRAEAPVPAPAPVHTPAPAPAPVADGGPAYSSPTTSGNTRITDAQRARAEGRSPVIEPGTQPAALTAALGLLLAGGAALGPYGLLLPLVLLQGLTAAGWFRLNGMWPARQGIALAFAGGLVADGALLAVGRENAAPAILGTLGAWVLLCLVLQLRSHADPDERMYGLMATVASAALTVIATGHLGAAPDAVVVGGIAVAAAVLAKALPLPGPVSVVAALLASAGAGIAAGGLTDLGASGALLGLGAGVCALVGLRAASYDYPSRFVHMTAGVALPLTAAAPAVYLLGRALA
ncbi:MULTISPECIES: hypothetical protein [unclassified Streptomyces]|uniref:hypothetical protein n=1 Tax=unclassified Streptomyces TaxID=2593676 RepID=UPI0006AFA248|nr:MULTISPECIES: hypothetical protein [unclassified Streptomyces]KOX21662.1 membrane protein [Streptomyces sp. NRRL F-6491]KOX42264.1 membrane protein [Streptomyces sp. NRRL F-6492]